jgi:phage-related protein
MVQVGREPTDFRPIPHVGPGAYERRARDETGAFRVIHVATFADALCALRAFRKRTRKTLQMDIALGARRSRSI